MDALLDHLGLHEPGWVRWLRPFVSGPIDRPDTVEKVRHNIRRR